MENNELVVYGENNEIVSCNFQRVDLIVTCLSEHSRNRRAGMLIGQGKSLEEAKQEVGMVIESIDNIEVAHELGKLHNIDMPIVEAVYGILYEGLKPEDAVNMLMNRKKKSEDNI